MWKMVVVCVDDHPVMLRGLEENARAAAPEARVCGFRNAQDAVLFAEKYGCDVLMCEIELPGEDGLSLARKIRAKFPQAEIIFVTVCSEKEHAAEIAPLKPAGYLTKPATGAQITRVFKRLNSPVRRK